MELGVQYDQNDLGNGFPSNYMFYIWHKRIRIGAWKVKTRLLTFGLFLSVLAQDHTVLPLLPSLNGSMLVGH